MFTLFAELIALPPRRAGAHGRSARRPCSDERKTAELRDQFIAVLGHDLRNPLNAIEAGVKLLEMMPHDAKAAQIVGADRAQRRPHGRPDRQRAGLRARPAGRRLPGPGRRRQPLAPCSNRSSPNSAPPGRPRRSRARCRSPGPSPATPRGSDRCSRTCSATRSRTATRPGRSGSEAHSDDGGFELSVTNSRRADSAGDGRAPVPPLLPRLRPRRATGFWARALHRLRDRPRPRRDAGRHVRRRRRASRSACRRRRDDPSGAPGFTM